jgi:YhcH/YjgK/YiaL family protein
VILDIIKNYKHYEKMSPLIARALQIAAQTDFEKLQDGKYEVDGDKLFYIVQRYKTKPSANKIEAHRKYIDIQFLVNGKERIGYAPANSLKQAVEYDPEKEVEFFQAEKNMTFLNMTKGYFAIFCPSDAHMPGCQMNEPEDVIKIVFKVKV